MTARCFFWAMPAVLVFHLQWRGGHVTARCFFWAMPAVLVFHLQWRGGHVTARCGRIERKVDQILRPSMEGRSRDRPMCGQ